MTPIRWMLLLLPALTILACGCGVSHAAANLTLADHGQAEAVIVTDAATMADDQRVAKPLQGQESDRRRLRESVRDLAQCLGKLTGGGFEIVTQPPGDGDKRVRIYVGEPAQAIFGPARPAPYQQGLRMVVDDRGVGLIGESPESTSYAVYELLHRLGCRWYMPGEMGEYIPSSPTIELEPMDLHTAPYTHYRGLWYADDAYRRRNRFGGLKLNAGHALEHYVSKEDREKNPQWRATVDGKPQPVRLKWSSPGLAEHIADVIIARHEANPQPTYSLSPDDGMGYDNSPEDKALDAGDFDPAFGDISNTDRLVWFVNRIAQRVNAKYPEVRFGLLAYANYTRPPVREKLHPSIIPQLAPINYRRAHSTLMEGVPGNKELQYIIKGWGQQASAMSYYYYGWFLAEPSAPNPFLTKWGMDVPLALANKCRFWQPETLPNFETTTHALYMSLRLAWDPTQKPQDIYDEINRRLYGHAAKEMAAYWQFIDDVWVNTPEYSGAGFAYNRRWTPQVMAEARKLMDAAILACQTPMELKRVRLADDSLRLFEQFMRIRQDFAAGQWRDLADDAQSWMTTMSYVGKQYAENHAFTRAGWAAETVNRKYYRAFYFKTYEDAARIRNQAVLLTPTPLAQWKYQADADDKGLDAGFANADFNDAAWPVTDLNTQTWSALGMHDYFGVVWYRQAVTLPRVPAGKKIFLWIGSTDGTARVYINGQHVPYVNDKGETLDEFRGYAKPASFDITQHVVAGKPVQVAIRTHRVFFNELGTGGLLSPLAVYREK